MVAPDTVSRDAVLVTFDVDGTLIQSVGEDANKFHKDAFAYAFKEVFGIDGTIDVIQHHGSTDILVAINTLEYYGIPKEVTSPQAEKIMQKMLEYVKEYSHEAGQGIQILPGVAILLEKLAKIHPSVLVGLVTGNLEPIAWAKMEQLGLVSFFSMPRFGGFGSDDVDRAQLVQIARSRAEGLFPHCNIKHHVHVGDTPNDIIAAESGGAVAVGVCTGIFHAEELQRVSTENAIILNNLEDHNAFLAASRIQTND